MACRRPSRKFYIPGFVQVLVGRRYFPGDPGYAWPDFHARNVQLSCFFGKATAATFEPELARWTPDWTGRGSSPHSPASRVNLFQETTVARGQALRSFRGKPESRIVHLIKTLKEFCDKRAGFRVKPGIIAPVKARKQHGVSPCRGKP